MRYRIVLWMLFLAVPSAIAQLSIGIGLPGVNIGINLPVFPNLVQVPGYPVYYAPQLRSNFFFYDGMYWVYQADSWYASTWYNGPWSLVTPEAVPLFVLRIPVRYYRNPPAYFRGWRPDMPPRWSEHWGNEWEQHRRGWDQWNHNSAPAPAPLPVYQRRYSGPQYPRAQQQQQSLHSQNYRYQPHDALVRPYYQGQPVQRSPAPLQRGQQNTQRSKPPAPPRQDGPTTLHPQPQQRGSEDVQRSAPVQAHTRQKDAAEQDRRQQPHQGPAPHEQQSPRSIQKNTQDGRDAPREPRHGPGPRQEKGDERAQERSK